MQIMVLFFVSVVKVWVFAVSWVFWELPYGFCALFLSSIVQYFIFLANYYERLLTLGEIYPSQHDFLSVYI